MTPTSAWYAAALTATYLLLLNWEVAPLVARWKRRRNPQWNPHRMRCALATWTYAAAAVALMGIAVAVHVRTTTDQLTPETIGTAGIGCLYASERAWAHGRTATRKPR